MRYWWIVILVGVLLMSVCGRAWAVQPNSIEMTAAQKWLGEHLRGEAAALPFSFTFGGKPAAELLNSWPLKQSTIKLDEQRTRHTLKYTDPGSKVEVRCEAIEYLDFPTVEWTLYFQNTGVADSPILENTWALDATWERDLECEFLLFEPIGHQCMTYGISFWLPFHGTGTVASAAAPYYGGGLTEVEPYAFWSNAAPSLVSGIDVRVKDLDYATLRRLYNQWRQISSCYCGDYYPLTPHRRDNKSWIAWQFDLPEQGKGMVQAFRRADNTDTGARLRLRGLDPQTRYVLKRLNGEEDKEQIELAGARLFEPGLPVTIEDRPGVAVITYEQTPEGR